MFAGHIGREAEITALGRTWTLCRWDRLIWREFLKWVKANSPDPLEAVTAHIDTIQLKDAETLRELLKRDMEEEVKARAENRQPVLIAPRFRDAADTILEKAVDKATSRLAIDSKETQAAVRDADGQLQVAWLLLHRKQPDVTLELAEQIVADCPKDKWDEALLIVTGQYHGAEKNGSDLMESPSSPPISAAA